MRPGRCLVRRIRLHTAEIPDDRHFRTGISCRPEYKAGRPVVRPAVLPEEKAPTRSPSKPQIRPAIYHPQKRTSIRSPKAATSRISADGYRRTSGNTNGGQPNNPKYTAVSSFRSSSTLRDAWAISATQNRKPRIFGRGCPRTGTLPSLKIGAPPDKGREGQPPVKYTMPFDSRP